MVKVVLLPLILGKELYPIAIAIGHNLSLLLLKPSSLARQ